MLLKKNIFSSLSIAVIVSLIIGGCSEVEELTETPDIAPLRQGFKTSAAIGYCTSLATMAFQGEQLPSNVLFEQKNSDEYSQSGILYVTPSVNQPLPFNTGINDIIIAGIWDDSRESGVLSIIFGDLDIFDGRYKFYGIHTIPFGRKRDSERFVSVYAEQDIVIGQGSDTLVEVGLSRIQFDQELARLEEEQPADVFVAAKQNVWFVQTYVNELSDVYDDSYEINGGGQIVSASSTEGGITYHALIETTFDFSQCNLNPTAGTAFIQNVKAGEAIDLGNILLDFHNECDGQATISWATGNFLNSNGKTLELGLN